MSNAPVVKPVNVKPTKKGKVGGPTNEERKALGRNLSRAKNQRGG